MTVSKNSMRSWALLVWEYWWWCSSSPCSAWAWGCGSPGGCREEEEDGDSLSPATAVEDLNHTSPVLQSVLTTRLPTLLFLQSPLTLFTLITGNVNTWLLNLTFLIMLNTTFRFVIFQFCDRDSVWLATRTSGWTELWKCFQLLRWYQLSVSWEEDQPSGC